MPAPSPRVKVQSARWVKSQSAQTRQGVVSLHIHDHFAERRCPVLGGGFALLRLESADEDPLLLLWHPLPSLNEAGASALATPSEPKSVALFERESLAVFGLPFAQ